MICIAISSKSGCGNTTVSRIVAERLGLRHINFTFHDMARLKGISFSEMCRLAESDPRYDRELDRRQIEQASAVDCVLASRLAIWLLERADLKVYLTATIETRARRIATREKRTIAQALEQTQARDLRDRERYRRLYGIDIDHHDIADLTIDTEQGDQFIVAERNTGRAAALLGIIPADHEHHSGASLS